MIGIILGYCLGLSIIFLVGDVFRYVYKDAPRIIESASLLNLILSASAVAAYKEFL